MQNLYEICEYIIPNLFTVNLKLLNISFAEKFLNYSKLFSLAIFFSNAVYDIILYCLKIKIFVKKDFLIYAKYLFIIFIFPQILKLFFIYSNTIICDIYIFRPFTFKNLFPDFKNSIFYKIISFELILLYFEMLIRGICLIILITFSPFAICKNFYVSLTIRYFIYICISNFIQLILLNLLCLINSKLNTEFLFLSINICWIFITLLIPVYVKYCRFISL